MDRGAPNLLGKPKVQNLGVPPLSDENVRRLDIAVNDSLAVRSFQRVCNLDADIQQQFQIHGTSRDAMLQSRPIEEFHHQVGLPVLLANFVNRADVGMIQRRRGSRLTPESLERLRVLVQFTGKKFQRNGAAKILILGLVHHTHTATTEPFDHAVVRDGTSNRRLRFRHAGRSS